MVAALIVSNLKDVGGISSKAIESAKAEDDLDKAVGIVEGAALAEPQIQRPAYYEYLLYEQELKTALLRIGYMVTESRLGADQGFDFIVRKDGKVIDVEAKRYKRPVDATTVYSIIGKASHRTIPVLLVASRRSRTRLSALFPKPKM